MKHRYELPDGSWGSREKAAKVYIEQGCLDHPGHRITSECPSHALYKGLQRAFRTEGSDTFQLAYDASWPPSIARNQAFLLEFGSSKKDGSRIKANDPLYTCWRHYVSPTSTVYCKEFRENYDVAFPAQKPDSGMRGKAHNEQRLYSVYMIDGSDFMYSVGPDIYYYCHGELTCISIEDRAFLMLYGSDVVRIPFSGSHYHPRNEWMDAALAKRESDTSIDITVVPA